MNYKRSVNNIKCLHEKSSDNFEIFNLELKYVDDDFNFKKKKNYCYRNAIDSTFIRKFRNDTGWECARNVKCNTLRKFQQFSLMLAWHVCECINISLYTAFATDTTSTTTQKYDEKPFELNIYKCVSDTNIRCVIKTLYNTFEKEEEEKSTLHS